LAEEKKSLQTYHVKRIQDKFAKEEWVKHANEVPVILRRLYTHFDSFYNV
jgi:hypothetical protein